MRRDSPPGLLLIDSEPAQAGLIGALAQRAGWRVMRAADIGSAIDLLKCRDNRVDVALLDIWSPGEASMQALKELRDCTGELPIIVVTAQDSVDLAVRAIRSGATDLILKPVAAPRLLAALENVASAKGTAGELRPLAEKWPAALDFDDIVGSAPGFRRAIDTALRAANTAATLLIEGEAGVGKDMLAQAVHRASPLAAGPLITVDCGAIPAIIESGLDRI